MQLDEELAVALGATREQARALAQRYWREVFPRMPNEYRAVDCFEGGPLDASPDDGLWPGRSEVLAGS